MLQYRAAIANNSSEMSVKAKILWYTLGLLLLSVSSRGVTSQDIPVGAKWIPTDLNYGVISQLRQNSLQTLPDQIAGMMPFGSVVCSQFRPTLSQLNV